MIVESTRADLPPTDERSTWVLVSNELLEKMIEGGWSEPLRVMIDPPNQHRDYPEMIFRQDYV